MEINLSGTEFINDFDKAMISDLVGKTFDRQGYVRSMDVKIKVHNEAGERKKYTIHMIAQSNFGIYNAESFDWQLNVAVKEVLGKLERQMKKDLEKRKG